MQGKWLRGIVDQLQLDGSGRVQVVEHKTRARPTLPRASQQQSARLQVALYRHMLTSFRDLTDTQVASASAVKI